MGKKLESYKTEPMYFQLKPEDEPLTKAALGMGDWLLAHPSTTEEQKTAILLLQEGLRRLPAMTPGLDAEYGFSIVADEGVLVGLYRSWQVSLYPPGNLDITSLYTPFPYPSDQQEWYELAHEMMAHELSFEIRAGKSHNIGTYYFEEWIAEVGSPELHLKDGVHLEIEAEMRDVTAK